jgi:UDP-2,3-diacylglucosamine pyrophosphatase LpxH
MTQQNTPFRLIFIILIAGGLTQLPLGLKAQSKIIFVSDTQAPMWVEKVALGSNQNVRATGLIFHDIIRQQPKSLFILGDVVTLGYKNKKWSKMDAYLDTCRKNGIQVTALLGNHDVMSNARKGETQFQKRFPEHDKTGYYLVVDSTAVVFLNSNFKKLSPSEIDRQKSWLHSTLQALDSDPAVLTALVACHHAPYSNSKVVGSSKTVQEHFVPEFLRSKKGRLFITGHSHNYEHFIQEGKDFLVIGGGGGVSQPVKKGYDDLAASYKPQFHYLLLQRNKNTLKLTSRYLKSDFSGFEEGLTFSVPIH